MAQEQHLNTFENGLTSDVSIMYQPDGTYRYMKNCQLISQDGNNFTVKDCMGNVKLFTLNSPYDGTIGAVGASPVSIGFISFPDALVVFSTNDTTTTGGYGEIGILSYYPWGEGYQPQSLAGNDINEGYYVLYHHASLKFTIKQQIEGFAFEENEALRRVYWTDNMNPPRVLNIADPIFSTDFGTSDLVVGDTYMVLQGYATYDGVDYGPGLNDGNIFTATVGGGTSYTTGLGTTRVIKYYPYELLAFTPSRKPANIKFDEYGDGQVYCGAKIYFYRLRKVTEGITTPWSYGSFPIHVGTTNDGVVAESNIAYFNFVGNQTEATLVNSGFSVKVNVSEIDTSFDMIDLACAEYDQNLNTIRQITIVASEEITSSDMSITHTGALNLGTLTVDDVTLFPISILTCKTMTTNKNYALVGNIIERMELDFDKTGVTIGQTDYLLPCHPYGTACGNIMSYAPIYAPANSNPAAGDILEGTHWIVSSVTGTGTVTYNAVTYNAGDIFVGVSGVQALTGTAGDGQARPCHAYKKYVSQNSGGATRWNYVQIKQGSMPAAYWNYKHPATQNHVKGYWNGDTYRFGILFYDKTGSPYYVRHLNDYTFDVQNTAGNSYVDNAGGVDVVDALVHGLTISNIRISKELAENISGFSIVRAERDKRILCQALMWQIGSDGASPANYYPTANVVQNNTYYNTNALNKYLIVVPDWAAGFEGITPTTANFSFLELASWIATSTSNKANEQNNNWETQLFVDQLNDSNGVVQKEIIYVQDVNERGTITSIAFNEAGADYFNQLFVGATLNIDTTCIGASPTDQGNSGACGNKHIVIELGSTFLYDSSANDYSDLAAAGGHKALVNIVFDNAASQYGGTSDISLANTLYIQCGHFQPINDQVIIDNNDTNDPTNYTELIFDEVEVYGGDAYTCIVDNGFGLYDDTMGPDLPAVPVTDNFFSYSIKFPCQLNVNYDLRYGRTIAKNRMHTTLNGVVYSSAAATRLEEFYYNNSYSSEGTAFSYPALPLNYPNNNKFRTRIRYAGPKINGELTNSFRTFLASDYKDMDGGGGEINNLRTKNNQTVVWQNAVVSTVPILERQVISGLSGAETVIGTGGVVDRFDQISSFFGNQHQWGLTQTEFGFVWFDMRRKGFVALDFGNGIAELSQINGLKGFFDEIFLESPLYNEVFDEYINDPNFRASSDRPLTGFGITGVYDPKFKMVYMTFKFKLRNREYRPGQVIMDIAKDFTIGYYHPKKMFIGFFDCTPGIWWNHNQLVLASNNPKNPTVYYGPTMATQHFNVGDIIGDTTKTYICGTAGTVSSYVSPPTASYFTEIADWDEIWIHNQPANDGGYGATAGDYQYSSFFGAAVNNEMTFVVNPKTQNPFAVLNMEQEGNNVSFTDLTVTAGTQTATDSDIPTSSKFYRVIWDKICSSLPISSTGRIVNSYLSVNWVKKNWSTNPRVVSKGVKILRYVRSFFAEKR